MCVCAQSQCKQGATRQMHHARTPFLSRSSHCLWASDFLEFIARGAQIASPRRIASNAGCEHSAARAPSVLRSPTSPELPTARSHPRALSRRGLSALGRSGPCLQPDVEEGDLGMRREPIVFGFPARGASRTRSICLPQRRLQGGLSPTESRTLANDGAIFGVATTTRSCPGLGMRACVGWVHR